MKPEIRIILVGTLMVDPVANGVLSQILELLYFNKVKTICCYEKATKNLMISKIINVAKRCEGDSHEFIEIASKTSEAINPDALLDHHFRSLTKNLLSQVLPKFGKKEGVIVWMAEYGDVRLLATYLNFLLQSNKEYNVKITPILPISHYGQRSISDIYKEVASKDINYLPEDIAEIYKGINPIEIIFEEKSKAFNSGKFNETLENMILLLKGRDIKERFITITEFDSEKAEIILKAKGVIGSVNSKDMAQVYISYESLNGSQRQKLGIKRKIMTLTPIEKCFIEPMPGIIFQETDQLNKFSIVGSERLFCFIDKMLKAASKVDLVVVEDDDITCNYGMKGYVKQSKKSR